MCRGWGWNSLGVGAFGGGVGMCVTGVCLGVDLVGGGMGVFVGGAEAFGFGWEGFGWGAGVGTASVFSFR